MSYTLHQGQGSSTDTGFFLPVSILETGLVTRKKESQAGDLHETIKLPGLFIFIREWIQNREINPFIQSQWQNILKCINWTCKNSGTPWKCKTYVQEYNKENNFM